MNLIFTPFSLPVFYLDPGSGSLIIQLALAALLGIGIAVRLGWSRIKTALGGKKPAEPAPTEEEDDQ